MTGVKLFFPQDRIDSWMSRGSVDFDTVAMSPAGGGAPIGVEPAVLFVREDGGTSDPAGLIGKVKTDAQLKDMGADHYRDSVIVGETAYGVVEGYVGQIQGAAAGEEAGASAQGAPPVKEPSPSEEPAAPAPAAGKEPRNADRAKKADAGSGAGKAPKADKGQKDSKGGVDVDELARLLIEKL